MKLASLAVAASFLLFLSLLVASAGAGDGGGASDRCDPGPYAHCAGASLTFADLGRADLRGADLRGAALGASYLYGAVLAGADLRAADLRGADLTAADLTAARLAGANLADANLGFATLRRGQLANAYLCRTALPGGGIARRDCAAPSTPGMPPAVAATSRRAALAAAAPGGGPKTRPGGGSRSRPVNVSVRVRGKGRVLLAGVRGSGPRRAPRLRCPGRCRARFPAGSVLVLNAKPRRGQSFAGWTGRAACGKRPRCLLGVRTKGSQNRVVARFTAAPAPPSGGGARPGQPKGRGPMGVVPLQPSTPSTPVNPVDPSLPVTPVCAVPPTQDSDGDGLPDCFEKAGWSLFVATPSDLGGGAGGATRAVSSDPAVADTDGDGIRDGDELQANSDPSRTDTDHDGLGDRVEIESYLSRPNHADSDSDSVPPGGGPRDARLFDGGEVAGLGTSPRLPDTDGDGLSDFIEAARELTNPRIADMPNVSLIAVPGLSDPQLDLDYEVEEASGVEKERATTTGEASSSEASTETSREVTNEHSFESSTESKCGVSSKAAGCSLKQSFTSSNTHSVTTGSQSGFSNSREMSREHEEIASTSAERKVTLGGVGCIQVVLRLANTGPVSVSVGNLQVLAWVPDFSAPNSSRLLAAMEPIDGQEISNNCPATAPGFGPVELPPGGSVDVAFSQQVDTKVILDYFANPSPISYELGPITMTGTNLAGEKVDFLGETATKVGDRTTRVEIDYGNGDLHRFSVATSNRLGTDGRSVGVTLAEALGQGLGGLEPVFGPVGEPPVDKLTSLLDPASGEAIANQDDPKEGNWNVIGDADGIGEAALAWDEIVLHPGQTVNLLYARDSDEDGLPDGYEGDIGSDPLSADTDGDELIDPEEVQVGWTVPFARGSQSQYKAFPSPLGCDGDGDGSPDGPGPGNALYGFCPTDLGPESTRLTDPLLADTNSDGQRDGAQPLPDALKAVPVGGRMPVQIRKWGGQASFGTTRPEGIAVDPNQPLFDKEGRAAPIESYVIQRNPGESDEVTVFTGNPRAEVPSRRTLTLDPVASELGFSESLELAATGIAVGRTTVGSGNSEGSPVYVNFYTKQTSPPAGFHNVLLTFNGTTGADISGKGGVGDEGIVTGGYGGACCFPAPKPFGLEFSPYGNGFLDSASLNGVVVGHGYDSSPTVNNSAPGTTDPGAAKARPTMYIGRGDTEIRPTHRYGEKAASATDPKAGELVDPAGIAIDRGSDALYVADDIGRTTASEYAAQGAISRFDLASGKVEAFSGLREELSGVRGIDVDDEGRYLYAVSATNGTIYKLSPSLAILGRIGAPSESPPFGEPWDVDVDAADGVWITDRGSREIHFFFYPFGP